MKVICDKYKICKFEKCYAKTEHEKGIACNPMKFCSMGALKDVKCVEVK